MPTIEAQRQRKRAILLGTAALVVALVANALVGVLLIVTRAQNADYAACTGRWQQQFSVAYLARSDAAAETSDALSKLLLTLPRDGASEFDKAKFNAALVNYVEVYQNQLDERSRNPLPPLPQTLCGKPAGGRS